jgi:hypothetical protein
MIQRVIHCFRYWFISCVVLISVLLTFFSTTGLGAFGGNAHAQAANASSLARCVKQACDNSCRTHEHNFMPTCPTLSYVR